MKFSPSPSSPSPKLFYIVGASGSGKDTLLKKYREHLAEKKLPVVIAHRYITRENSEKNQATENFISLSANEYQLKKSQGLFLLDWEANNSCYAIGIEVAQWFAMGFSVVINGSRAYLPMLKEAIRASHFGRHISPHNDVVTISINVPETILLERLRLRQRESEAAIELRMKRHRNLMALGNTDNTIDNSGAISASVIKLANIIDKATQRSCAS
ncbi:MAG: hypothetical protein ACRBBR_09860 [Cellvibrionaceae bacterium]